MPVGAARVDVGLVLLAAGRGTRLGAGRPKGLVPLGDGEDAAPIVVHALRGALRCPAFTDVVVVAPDDPQSRDEVADAVAGVDAVAGARIRVVAGGAERPDSVVRGLRSLSEAVRIVLVHDAARALTPPEVFDRVVAAVRAGHEAVTPALPVTDTVKQVTAGPADTETVVATLDRTTLRAVQTPQGFLRETLERAHAASGPGRAELSTDDCGLVEACGGRVSVVAGSPAGLKITTPHDLELAEAWLARRLPAPATDQRPVTA